MRFFSIGLLLTSVSLSGCTTPTAESSSAVAPADAPAHSSASSGIATSGVPGPDPNYRQVQAEDILSEDTVYAATLPALNDADGAIQVRVAVNPQAHTLEKINLFFVPRQSAVIYKQVGQGIGKYEPTTGHYYFDASYQKIRKLGYGRTDYGTIQEIGGWVKPGSATAAVAHKGAMQ